MISPQPNSCVSEDHTTWKRHLEKFVTVDERGEWKKCAKAASAFTTDHRERKSRRLYGRKMKEKDRRAHVKDEREGQTCLRITMQKFSVADFSCELVNRIRRLSHSGESGTRAGARNITREKKDTFCANINVMHNDRDAIDLYSHILVTIARYTITLYQEWA